MNSNSHNSTLYCYKMKFWSKNILKSSIQPFRTLLTTVDDHNRKKLERKNHWSWKTESSPYKMYYRLPSKTLLRILVQCQLVTHTSTNEMNTSRAMFFRFLAQYKQMYRKKDILIKLRDATTTKPNCTQPICTYAYTKLVQKLLPKRNAH